MKKFKTQEIRDLFNRVMIGEISFPEMVETMNERASGANEPQYKDGDFVVNECGVIIIFKNKVGNSIYDHAYFSESAWVVVCSDAPTATPIKGYATEEQKKKILDELAKEGKRWNEEKKCVEDIPVRKFKRGNKVRIKHGVSSKTHYNIDPSFVEDMDGLIGKTMTVDRYTDWDNYVKCEGTVFSFLEEWLEPYVEDMPKRKFKKGDKVRIKDGISSGTVHGQEPVFQPSMDDFIGTTMTVNGYNDYGYVICEKSDWRFNEDWLEPYTDELKKGDLAIFWDHDKEFAIIRRYYRLNKGVEYRRHQDIQGLYWANAIKFESMEQYEKLIKGEI